MQSVQRLPTKHTINCSLLCWENETTFCPSAGKGEIWAASAEGIICSWGDAHRTYPEQRHICYSRALIENLLLQWTTWKLALICQVLRQDIYLAATLNLRCRNPKCSLNLMESNSSFSREEKSVLLACFSWPICWWGHRGLLLKAEDLERVKAKAVSCGLWPTGWILIQWVMENGTKLLFSGSF